ncbi:MAG TPA: hypothetical protein VNQ79_16845 [Blastocatellia bacterium]|nr:hypothetical protein [Blastocatellia bacterium]
MSYHNFSLSQVCQDFSLRAEMETDLFDSVSEVEASDFLKLALEKYVPLGEGANTEKSRSEFIIAPILAEARERSQVRVSLFSGVKFNVDVQRKLEGVCDFVFSHSSNIYELVAPVLMVVEAKKEDIPGGFGQCAAEMVAARLFNQQASNGITTIHGAVTTGNDWRFLKLEGDTVFVDKRLYYLTQINKLLGILLHILQDDHAAHAKAA